MPNVVNLMENISKHSWSYEKSHKQQGQQRIPGVNEAGRREVLTKELLKIHYVKPLRGVPKNNVPGHGQG